jgi:hypothetical protein
VAEEREKDIQLPKDRSNSPVQALGQSSSEVAAGTVAGSTARITIPSGSQIVEVASLTDCHIAFGDSTVEATTGSPAFPKGAAIYKVLPSQTHLAFILAAGASGAVLTVTRLK